MNNKLSKALLLCAPLLLGGCDMVLFDSKGQVGQNESDLILLAAGLMLLVVIPAIVLNFIFAIRYRATNTKATYKPDWGHSNKIEAVVWGVPCLIVVALSIVSWRTTHDLDPAQPIASNTPPITIDVVSLDWKWVFIYPAQHIATVNEIHFPVNTPVRFNITSDSVMNSFFIPQLGSQIYAMAGMRSRLNLIADTVGTYDGMSSNFSGDGFSGMKFEAIVTDKAGFDQWVATVRQAPRKLDAETYAALEKPSEDEPVQYFSTADGSLFDAIINKYMGMPMNGDSPMPMHSED